MNRKQQKTTENNRLLISAKKRFVLNIKGVHGIEHWERVRQNGLELAKNTEKPIYSLRFTDDEINSFPVAKKVSCLN